MNKAMQKLKQNQTLVICASVVVVAIICVLFSLLIVANSPAKLVSREGERYALAYDNTWKLEEKSATEIVLRRGNEGRVTIQIEKLPDEKKFATIGELVPELMQNIQDQNVEYGLLSTTPGRLTQDQYNGYKLLYENGDEQVLVALYKKGDELVTIGYEAPNEDFDILLDSVNNIIYNLKVKDESFALAENLALELGEITYAENEEVGRALDGARSYEIAKNNYLVEYTIPANFKQMELSSNWGYFAWEQDGGRMNISVDILNRNVYEYLDRDEATSVYKNYALARDDDAYVDYQETLARMDDSQNNYIYKNSYRKDGRLYENVELIYALDEMHTLKIKIESSGLPVTRKLVDMIKVGATTNYASYIKVEKEGGNLIGKLQKFTDYGGEAIDIVTLKVPEKYVEQDYGDNIYTDRYYGLNYNDELQVYDYEVHYELTTLPGEEVVKIINSSEMKTAYGSAQKLTLVGNLTLSGKNFQLYEGGYTDVRGVMFTTANRKKFYVYKNVLIHEIPGKGTLCIEIDGNGKEVTREVLSELTNFTIEEKQL